MTLLGYFSHFPNELLGEIIRYVPRIRDLESIMAINSLLKITVRPLVETVTWSEDDSISSLLFFPHLRAVDGEIKTDDADQIEALLRHPLTHLHIMISRAEERRSVKIFTAFCSHPNPVDIQISWFGIYYLCYSFGVLDVNLPGYANLNALLPILELSDCIVIDGMPSFVLPHIAYRSTRSGDNVAYLLNSDKGKIIRKISAVGGIRGTHFTPVSLFCGRVYPEVQEIVAPIPHDYIKQCVKTFPSVKRFFVDCGEESEEKMNNKVLYYQHLVETITNDSYIAPELKKCQLREIGNAIQDLQKTINNYDEYIAVYRKTLKAVQQEFPHLEILPIF